MVSCSGSQQVPYGVAFLLTDSNNKVTCSYLARQYWLYILWPWLNMFYFPDMIYTIWLSRLVGKNDCLFLNFADFSFDDIQLFVAKAIACVSGVPQLHILIWSDTIFPSELMACCYTLNC